MKLPRDLSGRQVVQGLCRDWGYRAVLRIGTLSSILRAVSRHKGVDRDALLKISEIKSGRLHLPETPCVLDNDALVHRTLPVRQE